MTPIEAWLLFIALCLVFGAAFDWIGKKGK